MKRFLLVLIGVAAVVALTTLPASAADFKFGGMFWTKYYSTNNLTDGNDDIDDNLNGFYTRMRLYFTATASENLMAVFKGEIDDVWGNGRLGTVSTDGGSLGRSDNPTQSGANSGMEIKNAYIQFNVPNTPLTFMAGALPAKIGSGLVFNDDTNGIIAAANFHPFRAVAVYSRLNDNASSISASNTPVTPYDSSDDWDLWAGELRFRAMKELELTLGGSWVNTTVKSGGEKNDVDLYNLVLDADFKTDLFSLYFTGGKNFGSAENANPKGKDADYKGFLISAGGAVNVKPVLIGADFFYSSGSNNTDDIETYVTPGIDGRNTYYMDEIVFPGMFDDYNATISGTFNGLPGQAPNPNLTNRTATGLTRTNQGYTMTNLWAIGAHVDFKPLEQTLLQAGGAWIQLARERPADSLNNNGTPSGKTGTDDKVGTSLYLRLTQGIVDGLQLKAAFGYLFADDGYTAFGSDDDSYKFATGLFWSW
jgi:hypothetical protein